MNPTKHLASRRKFFKLLAGSPLFALAYPVLPANWKEMVSKEVLGGGRPSGTMCPDCGQEMILPSPVHTRGYSMQARAVAQQPAVAQQAELPRDRFLEGQLEGQVVKSVEEAINVWDFEMTLHANNLPEHWAYIHMGVNDFETRRANREGYQSVQLIPRRLGRDVTKVDTSVQLFDRKWSSPLVLCPVAAQGAYHSEAESGVGRAARAKGVLQVQANGSTHSYEQISAARGEPHWFQIYTSPDFDVNKRLIARVQKAGCPVLVWTIDLLGGSNRELARRYSTGEYTDAAFCQNCHAHKPGSQNPMREGTEGPPGPRYPYTWDYVKRLKDVTTMKVVLKGIVTREDAERAVESGADGIWVSNHGGRAEASNRSTIESLPEVVAGVNGRVPIIIDSGVRRGLDVFKAVALGADAVGVGRPYVWGLGSFGQPGVEAVIEMILSELAMVMRQASVTAIDQISAESVRQGPAAVNMRVNRLGFGL